MHTDKMIGQLTYHTLRYLHRDRFITEQFYACNNVNDVKKIIWERVKPTMITQEEIDGFKKGVALCDFNAIFEWLQNEKKK